VPAPKILAFAGSTREASYNKRLIKIAAEGARDAGAQVTLIDLAEFRLPLFDEDLEARDGLHPNGRLLKDLFISHQGLLISSPEYNSSITAVLKNTIDWVSRPVDGQPPLACYTGKVVTLMSSSPGALGGLRGLVHLRAILGNIGCLVLPEQISIPRAFEVFNEDGSLKDANKQASIAALGAGLAKVLSKLNA
jgi:chromate reductase, NAD(P)H dehydrogenase (quinone)